MTTGCASDLPRAGAPGRRAGGSSASAATERRRASLGRVGTRTHRIGRKTVKEPGGKFFSTHASPNERGDIFGPAIHGKARSGVVISVGTVRSVQDAVDATQGLKSIPRRFATYQFDVDPGIVKFNLLARAHLAADGATPERPSLRGSVIGMTPPPSPARELLKEIHPQFIGALLHPYTPSEQPSVGVRMRAGPPS